MAQQHFSKFWHFEPSLTLCIIALVLFSISTLLHVFQTIKYRQKFFIPFVLGGIFQIVGFIARIFCTQDLHDLASFIVQILFILLAPILYSASIYGLLEKLIKYTEAESLMPIRSALITIIFVTCDVVSFIVQAVGGSMESSSNISVLNAGNTIVLVGLGIQLPFFLFFLFLTGIFDKRTFHQTRKPNQGNWKLLLRVLELSSLLILIRSVYRIVEYGLGYNGYLMNHEGFFYIFDSLMMLLTQILYNVVYPGAILTPLAVSSNKTSSVSVSVSVPASASAPMGYDLAKVAVESQVNQSPDPACQA